MIVCENCFIDPFLVDLVKNSKEVSGAEYYKECPYCCESNPKLHDFQVPEGVSAQLSQILELYEPSDNNKKGENLIDVLKKRWRIFSNNISIVSGLKLLKLLVDDSFDFKRDPFSLKVVLRPVLANQLKSDETIFFCSCNGSLDNIVESSWDNFEESVKYRNRFFSNVLNKKIFEIFCGYLTREVEKNQLLYRARVSTVNRTFSYNEIYAPEKGTSNDGRLNAKGEWCLYLSSELDTCIHEVRAVAHDYVCVGKFKLKEKIQIVDFSLIESRISPFFDDFDINLYLININFLLKIRSLFSKVVRTNSDGLDYVTTQFLADCIKSMKESENPDSKYKFAGISYPSTVSSLEFELDRPTVLYEITDVSYTKNEVQDN